MSPKHDSEFLEKHIETLALQGQWDIDLEWGTTQLAQFLQEMEMVRGGIPYSELGIGKRRAASKPEILSAEGQRVSGSKNLKSKESVQPGSIAILNLHGVMRSSDGLSTRGVKSLISDLYAAYENPHIEGILLDVDSGGGESQAGTMLQNALTDSPKAVVTYFHLMASAAVRATLPTDEIIAAGEGAQAGSIGTYITLDKWFAGFYSRYYEDVYADKSTNKNRAFREYLKNNTEPLREELNRQNDLFLAEVQKYRQLRGNIEDTLSGSMFLAKTAKQRGLADGIGSFQYAQQRLWANIRRRQKI